MLKLVETQHDEIIINVTHIDYVSYYKGDCLIKFHSGEWQTVHGITMKDLFKQLGVRKIR